MIQSMVKEIEVTHKHYITPLSGRRRFARLVVWAITGIGDRVWVRTVEGGLDSLLIEVKVAMVQEFFKKLVGHEICFRKKSGGKEKIFFVEGGSLPHYFLVSYQEIKELMREWVQTHYGEKLQGRTTEATIERARRESYRKEVAIGQGLSENAGWPEIKRAIVQRKRAKARG